MGGSAAAATLVLKRRPRLGGVASVGAGAVLASWIAGEMAFLDQPSDPARTESVYLVLAAAMALPGGKVARGGGHAPS